MEDLISIFSGYSFVKNYRVLHFETTRTTRRLKISIEISEATSPRGFRYAYHWQDSKSHLLARWDNAPHYPDMPTFPDHFHNGQHIKPTSQPTIRDVLEYLGQSLKK